VPLLKTSENSDTILFATVRRRKSADLASERTEIKVSAIDNSNSL